MGDPGDLLPEGYDALVDSSDELDVFCSSTDWIVPAHQTWGPRDLLVAADDGAGLALARMATTWGGPVLCGLDPVWGFACPVIGADPRCGAELTARVLGRRGVRWNAALLTGLLPESRREACLVEFLGRRYRLREGPAMTRCLADLGEGLDGFLARRSASFRRNLRQAERRWEILALDVELVCGGGPEVIDRCVAIERRSWKGAEAAGLSDSTFAAFYRAMASRLEGEGRLRAGFARHEGCDVGFILGAVRGRRYRGLQLSYDDRYARCSVGNVLQLRQMAALVGEGVVEYDLGMDMAYKRLWSDRELTTRTLVVARR